MEAIQSIWQENKRFILQVGGGLAVFLILKSCIVDGYVGGGSKDAWKSNQKLEEEVLKLRGRVVQRYPEEKKGLADLEKIETDLAGRFLTPAPKDVPDPKRGAAQIQFSERIDRFWNELRAKANTKNVKIPEKITNNELGVFAGDSPEDLARSTAYLEILGRVLRVCVDLGMTQIDKPTVYPEEALPVRDNDGVSTVYRRVGLTVYGPFDGFKRILREYQNPGGFIQVRLVGLDSKVSTGALSLKGQLEFVAVFFEKEAEAEAAATEGEAPKASKDAKGATRKFRRKKG